MLDSALDFLRAASGHRPTMAHDRPPLCTITFGRSPSLYYRDALRLAQASPGYGRGDAHGPERHTVAVDLQALPLVEPLIRLIAGWRGASVQISGFVLRREEVTALLRVLACYRDRERAGFDELYCWGLPGHERGRVPCRIVDLALPWLPPSEYADPDLRPRLLQAHASTTFAALCPAFDPEAMRAAATAALDPERQARAQIDRLLSDLELDL